MYCNGDGEGKLRRHPAKRDSPGCGRVRVYYIAHEENSKSEIDSSIQYRLFLLTTQSSYISRVTWSTLHQWRQWIGGGGRNKQHILQHWPSLWRNNYNLSSATQLATLLPSAITTSRTLRFPVPMAKYSQYCKISLIMRQLWISTLLRKRCQSRNYAITCQAAVIGS